MSDTFGRTVAAATGPAGGVVAAGNADGQELVPMHLAEVLAAGLTGEHP